MLRSLLFLALLGAGNPAVAQPAVSAPVVPAAAPASADDSLKGLIWSKTAQLVWQANPAKAPARRPAAWATATEFKSWCNAASNPDKSGLLGLKNQVMGAFSGNTASAQQLIDSIVAGVAQARAQGTELRKVDAQALAASLNSLPGVAGAAAPAARQAPQPETAVARPAPPPPGTAPTAPTNLPPPPAGTGGFIAENPAMTLGLTFLLGMIAGAMLTLIYRRSRPAPFTELHVPPVADEPKAVRPRPVAQPSFRQLQQEAEEMKKAKAAAPVPPPAEPPQKKSPAPKPAPASPPAPTPPVPAPPAADESAPVAASVPAPPIARYAPAQEGGYIEERKLVAEPLPQLPIMLTIDARHPDRATFTLNPGVNQGKLIGDGLEQLRDYFEYELPGRISSVAAAGAGQLLRQGEGWQVAIRARLEVR